MHVPITTATLALLTVAIILLRVFWLRLPLNLRSFLIWSASMAIMVRLLLILTKWSLSPDRVNALLNWSSVAGYELLILLFTLLPPKWLTVSSAIILLIPVFAASSMNPLTRLFERPDEVVSLGDHLVSDKSHWDSGAGATSGVELIVFYKPPFAPFLRRARQHALFNNDECNASAAFATLSPDHKTVLFHCPLWPSQQRVSPVVQLLPLS